MGVLILVQEYQDFLLQLEDRVAVVLVVVVLQDRQVMLVVIHLPKAIMAAMVITCPLLHDQVVVVEVAQEVLVGTLQ
jgi:hypothetical protein